MKQAYFLGDSKKRLVAFPEGARREAGYQLDKVQNGDDPSDWKPMTTIGMGVKEIRIKIDGEHRIIYLANVGELVYVLHAFTKKTQRTPRADIELARQRLKRITRN
jgi:phage-related protein